MILCYSMCAVISFARRHQESTACSMLQGTLSCIIVRPCHCWPSSLFTKLEQ